MELRRSRVGLVLVLVLGVTLAASLAADAKGDLSRREAVRRAKQVLSGQTGTPRADLQTGAYRLASLPSLEASYHAVKVYDPGSDATFSVTVGSDGSLVDEDALLAEELGAERLVRGKLDAETAAWVKSGAGGSALVYLIVDDSGFEFEPPPDVTGGLKGEDRRAAAVAAAEYRSELMAYNTEAVARAVAPVEARLQAMGIDYVTQEDTPLIIAKVTRKELSAVEQWSEVLHVGAEQKVQSLINTGFYYAVNADAVHARGVTGRGVKIAQVEYNGQPNLGNPYLQGHIIEESKSKYLFNYSTHAAFVAGILRWYSPGAYILAASGYTSPTNFTSTGGDLTLISATARSILWGATVINHSWGEKPGNSTLGYNDWWLDRYAYNNRTLSVVAAGNDGQTSRYVGSPATGYNVLAVGNYDDQNTASWSDDRMHPSSSYQDPASTKGDRELPHVVAPGSRIRSARDKQPWYEYYTPGNQVTSHGTSFSAPVVTSEVALILQRRSDLAIWPVVTKAIVMASARRNLSSGREYDGVGGVHFPDADDTVRALHGSNFVGNNIDCSFSSRDQQVYIPAGKLIRIAQVWNSNHNYSGYWSQPSADLDLSLYSPGGSRVAVSESWDNTHEFIAYRAPTSGTYTIRTNMATVNGQKRCYASPGSYSVAWWRES